jgi:hypothetical protein
MFVSNDVLDRVVERLAQHQPDWGYLSNVTKLSSFRNKKEINRDNLLSHLSEFHLKHFLKHCHGEGDLLNSRPLSLGKDKGGYVFRQDGDHICCHKSSENDAYAEYDKVVLCDRLPVCFEMSLTTKKRGWRPSKKGNRRVPRGLSQLLGNEEYLLNRTAPIDAHFSTKNQGYVVVVYPSMINPDAPSQQQFDEWGGHLVPFYADRDQYVEDVTRFAKDYGFCIVSP